MTPEDLLRNELTIVEDERDRYRGEADRLREKLRSVNSDMSLMSQRVECLEQALANMGEMIEEARRVSLVIGSGGRVVQAQFGRTG